MTPSIKVNVTNNMPAVQKAVDKAAFRNFRHAAASISKDAKASLATAEGPSAAGSPPHTHKGAFLRRAIRYAADGDGALIGPMASVVGQAGAAHEFGEDFRGTDYDERPFMGPALERAIPRFAGDWAGSVGE
jgi:hypothetical protein